MPEKPPNQSKEVCIETHRSNRYIPRSKQSEIVRLIHDATMNKANVSLSLANNKYYAATYMRHTACS